MAESYPFPSRDSSGGSRPMVGAMSGTSADGVDAALVDVGGDWPRPAVRLLGHHAHPYPTALRQRLFAVREQAAVALSELAALARDISLEYARAVGGLLQKTGHTSDQVAAIAAHGQTLFHRPPLTIQWLNPAVLAHETGCRVVTDFRSADCAAGGQGAPLVPFADWILFAHDQRSRIVLNLGGIANITHLPAGSTPGQVTAFDTGPANCLSDWLCRTLDPHGLGYDEDGQRAMAGRRRPAVSAAFLTDAYFRRRPPKSTDGPEMIQAFRRAIRQGGAVEEASHLNDLLATAAHDVARAITDAAQGLAAHEWIVAGGGARNRAVMTQLRAMLPPQTPIQMADQLGIPSQSREAMAFALLGAATLAGLPANVPAATGADRGVILGAITPKP